MAFLDISRVSKSFGTLSILENVDLTIERGEFVVFVGPSGCGKSTLLRMISGLEDVTSGTISIEGEVVNDMEPARRGTAMVFQSYALYPHMTTFQNMSFGLRMAHRPRDFIAAQVQKAARILQLDKLLDRRPGQLSGGQKQRVAIGRAIVREPRVFLFDEPLSNLDAELRVQMRAELMDLHRRLGTTMIYVTHDQVEAMTLADKMVVMQGGRVQQAGRPLDLYDDPDNRFVAGFVGSPRMNFLPARVTGAEAGGLRLALPGNVPEVDFALVWIVGGACALGAAWQAKYHRFAALVMLGGAGVVTCITFAWFSAPDLAVTQLVVEIVTTALLLLGLRWLPKRNEEILSDTEWPARVRRWRDFALAAVVGTGVAAIAFSVMSTPRTREISSWFLANAYAEGGGTNAVNVILVDFRAFDTFGEITVLGVVALIVFSLLRRFRPAQESVDRPEQQRFQLTRDRDDEERDEDETVRDYLFVPSVIMQWMFPVIILLSAYLFLRGHDLPGGGFAGGVTLAIGFLLQYLAADARWVEDRLTVLPVRWIAVGLLMAGITGLGSWLFGYPFLTAHAQYVHLPLIGDVPAATTWGSICWATGRRPSPSCWCWTGFRR